MGEARRKRQRTNSSSRKRGVYSEYLDRNLSGETKSDRIMTDLSERHLTDDREIASSSGYALESLLKDAEKLAMADGLNDVDIEELNAINEFRLAVESIRDRRYIFHSASATP